MSKHALEQIAGRVPGIDPQLALGEIKSGNHAGAVLKSVTGESIVETWISTGQTVFAVQGEDGTIKTVLTEGMTTPTTTGQVELRRSEPAEETVGGLTVKVIPDHYQVREPGAYRMSLEWYHSQAVCPGPSVSSTGIRKIAMQSPHSFWKTWEGNPNRYPPKPISDSLILGRAAHALILGDEVFDDAFVYVPEDAPQRPTATQIRAFERDGEWSEKARPGAEWWAAFDAKAKGKLELKQEQLQRIMYMAENLRANQHCVDLLKSDLVEISMIWQDEQTGIWVKSRPDCIPSNGADFSDLKTFAPKSRDLILSAHRSITDFGYSMQMALAVMGSEQIFGMTAKDCALVFAQTSEPYEVIPVVIEEDTIYWARVLCRYGLNRMAECLKSNDWPGVGESLTTYALPPSMTERLSDLQASGEMPNL